MKLLKLIKIFVTICVLTSPFISESKITKEQNTKTTINLLKDLTALAHTDNIKKMKKNEKALVYFWAEWCPDCKQKLRGDLKQWHKKEIAIFTINKDARQKRAERFLKKYKITLPVYLDKSKKISSALKALSVPHWAVIEYKREVWEVIKTGSGNLDPAKAYFKDKLEKTKS